MKVDVEKLMEFLKQNKEKEYYYLLADGQIVKFEIEKDVFIPWVLKTEEEAIGIVSNLNSKEHNKHYQYIKTLNKIENWMKI